MTGKFLPPAKSTNPKNHHRFYPQWILFVALRYMRTRRQNKGNTATVLSIVGLSLGTAVLITVISIMNAFQMPTIEKILAFNSFHVKMDKQILDKYLPAGKNYSDLLKDLSGLRALTPYRDVQGMMQGHYNRSLAVNLRAVPSGHLESDKSFAETVRLTEGDLKLRKGEVILGRLLSNSLGRGLGDMVEFLTLPPGAGLLQSDKQLLKIAGIIEVGYPEYDQYWGFVAQQTLSQASQDPSDVQIGFILDQSERDTDFIQELITHLSNGNSQIRDQLKTQIHSWRSYNSAIYGALRVEKLMIMLIIGLIFVVMAVNIFHGLRRSVLEKTEDIGVLRAIGARAFEIRLVFVGEGVLIGIISGLLGLLLGVLITSQIANIISALELALGFVLRLFGNYDTISFFYLDRAPSHLIWSEAVISSLFAAASAFAASFAASLHISSIQPAEILRYE